MKWDRFVDAITLLWLGVFAADLVRPMPDVSALVLLGLLPIYLADLGVQYRRVGSFGLFLRKHWLTILMAIPYLRVLRLLRMARALRTLRVLRVARVGRWPGARRAANAIRKARRLGRSNPT